MLRLTRCLLTLVIVPSLSFAQATPPPSVRGVKIDAVKADPMPQGIKDLLVFTGAPKEWRPPPGVEVSPPIKGLSTTDKLALVRRAASTSGITATGTSMEPYLAFSYPGRIDGRGDLSYISARYVNYAGAIISSRGVGSVYLNVYGESAGRLYLAEFQVASTGDGLETTCSVIGSADLELTFRLRAGETSIIPMVFVSSTRGAHNFRLQCDRIWNFKSVDVSVLR